MEELERISRADRESDPDRLRKDVAEFWKTHVLSRIPTPKWENWGDHDLPLLSNPSAVQTTWMLDCQGTPTRAMETAAFETRSQSTVKFVGVTYPKGTVPAAFLICFRHTAKATDFPNAGVLLRRGVGDYLTGRMQLARQISASGKNVVAVVPVAVGSSGEFENNEQFVTSCLKEINKELFSGSVLPPLLLACNSDGIEKMHRFLINCPGLRAKVKAIFDLDGSKVIAARGITLSGTGAQVFRYSGLNAPPQGKTESEIAYLNRTMGASPAWIPLPLSRWEKHGRYNGPNDANWLHHFIPTCMVQHGLATASAL